VSKILLISIIYFFSAYALAEPYTPSNGHKVTSVFAGYLDKEAFFEIDGAGINPAECTGTPIAIDPQKSDVSHVLSILLYAHASGKSVDLQIYNESCLGGHRVLRRIKVNNS